MRPNCLDALEAGGTLVTANTRLARDLRRGYDTHRRSGGGLLWQAPDILAWSDWVERCWTASVEAGDGPAPVLLSPAQEQLLWERIIERSGEGQGLLTIPATAAAAAEAYALAASWEVPLRADDCYGFEDAAAFMEWAADFDRTVKAGNWMSRAHLALEVARLTGRGCFVPPRRLLYAGFDELSPAQQRLLEALTAAGCRVEPAEPPAVGAATQCCTALPDTAGEIVAAARWAHARVSQNPNARVGVVLPGLAAGQAMVERVFEDVLHPSYESAPPSRCRAFHISSGPVLAEVPIIAAALQVLGLGRRTLLLPEAGVLLRTPFLAGAEAERGPRALLDVELRRRSLAELTVATLARLAAARQPDGSPRAFRCPALARRLRAWRRIAARLPEQQLPAAWSRIFSRLLRLAGWPGDRTLTSPEYQAIARWNETLSEFAALDLVAEPMTYTESLARLRRLAAGNRFAPADEGAPIQVLGMLEAAGGSFDHLWVAGLEDRRWPSPPNPNPFLPPPVQRERGLPHFSAERELAWARRITERLLNSAGEVVVSYPLREGDTDLRPSPLIAGLTEAAPPVDGPTLASVLRGGGVPLERREDAAGPPLVPGAVPRGGMGIFERQAACPFSAFAQYRLGARPLEEPSPGFSAQERGTVLHAALDNFWREMGSHANLIDRPAEERQDLVRRSVAAAIEAKARGRGVEPLVRLKALEQERLERLLEEWLAVEAERAPFVVADSEQVRRVPMGGLTADIRIDRVDRLPDGREIVIDYKTGMVSPADWEGERPESPQLPLYAATHKPPLAAVLFAQLVPGKLRFHGLGENAGVPRCEEYARSKPGKAARATLAAHIAQWAGTLETLGAGFASGAAAVAPKRTATCERCQLAALCRVAELGIRADEGAEESDE